jgi:hypothetical protein
MNIVQHTTTFWDPVLREDLTNCEIAAHESTLKNEFQFEPPSVDE